MIEGAIDYLLSNSNEAEFLRENCVFKIIPMMNPDGVIHGNNRCSLAGCDTNRRWKEPSRVIYIRVKFRNFTLAFITLNK